MSKRPLAPHVQAAIAAGAQPKLAQPKMAPRPPVHRPPAVQAQRPPAPPPLSPAPRPPAAVQARRPPATPAPQAPPPPVAAPRQRLAPPPLPPPRRPAVQPAAPPRPAAVAGRRGAIQRATDMNLLSTTEASYLFQDDPTTPKTVRQLIDERHGGVLRDANYNNLGKVQFEEDLAMTILKNLWAVWGPVKSVSQKILEYIVERSESNINAINEALMRIKFESTILGSEHYQITEPYFEDIRAQIRQVVKAFKVLSDVSPASLHTHLMLQGRFYTFIYQIDYLSGRAQNIANAVGADYDAIYRGQAVVDEKDGGYHPLKPILDGNLFATRQGPVGRARLPRPGGAQPVAHVSGLSPQETDSPRFPYSSINGRPTLFRSRHGRGTDQFFVDESKTWAQDARIRLDMPLSAGASGSAALMFATALEMGLANAEEKKQYAMAVLASIVLGGHHTFHEVMVVADLMLDVPYRAGSYKGVYPASLTRLPDFDILKRRYPQFLA